MTASPNMSRRVKRLAQAGCIALAFGLALSGQAIAQAGKRLSMAEQFIQDMKDGKVAGEGSDDHVVQELIIKRNIPITYKYISVLMNTPNAFGTGVACTVCHNSNDTSKSYRGLDLSTCKGMIKGATEQPSHVVFTPGKDPKEDPLIRRLRNNRMPFGIGFDHPAFTAKHLLVKQWIADGAKNDDHFQKNIQPLFKTANTFAPNTPACVECHMSNQEPPSFHEMNLGTYEGIMLGADSVAQGIAGATKVVIPGKPEHSPLWQHLTEDRMPPGISPAESRDHPNTAILSAWIEQGAKCD